MADVSSTLPLWSTTEGSNQPAGSTSIGTGLDDNIRMCQKVVRGWLASKGADIASAATTDLGAVEGLFHDITGTVTITSFGTISAGIWKIIKFEGTLTLTHNATSLILRSGQNHSTTNGDVFGFISEGGGNWREIWRDVAGVVALNKAIYGFTYANNAGDATNDLDIAAGGAMDATGAYFIVGSALTKQSDVTWAVGTAAGGLDTGAVGNNDYYIWIIARSDTGVVDYLFSLSSTAPTMPTNYDFKRLIGWFKRVGGAIVTFTIYEVEGGGISLGWTTPTQDVNLSNTLTTSRRTDAVKVPLNFSVLAHLTVSEGDATTVAAVRIMCPDEADVAVSGTNANITQGSTGFNAYQKMSVRTSSAGLIAARANLATVDVYTVMTDGFTWARRN